MRDYAYPHIGNMAIDAVGTEDVLKVLRPIWTEIPETARRVRGRMEKILSSAKSEGLRTGENPALWHDHLVNVLPKKPKGGHHAALPYELAPQFWKSLRSDTSMGSKALQFIMLTAVRFNVAIPAVSSEINFDKALWNVPQERMKMDEEDYQVPLVKAAVELVRGRSGLLFPSPIGGGELTSTTLLKVGKRHSNGLKVTTHGWRSTFRDWVGDETDADWDTGEASLSHKIKDKTQAAYRRGVL
jgi:integrase